MKNLEITQNINLKNYNFEYTPAESTAGGTMLFIANHLAYKLRHGFKIYKNNELESTFIELINSKKTECFNWLHLQASIWFFFFQNDIDMFTNNIYNMRTIKKQ